MNAVHLIGIVTSICIVPSQGIGVGIAGHLVVGTADSILAVQILQLPTDWDISLIALSQELAEYIPLKSEIKNTRISYDIKKQRIRLNFDRNVDRLAQAMEQQSHANAKQKELSYLANLCCRLHCLVGDEEERL